MVTQLHLYRFLDRPLVMGFASSWVGRAVDWHGGLPVPASGSLLNAAGCLSLAYDHHPVAYCLAWIVLGLSMRLSEVNARKSSHLFPQGFHNLRPGKWRAPG